MSNNPRHIVSVSMYGNHRSRTLLHAVKDTLSELTGRHWTLTEAMRYCIEQQSAVLLQHITDCLKEKAPANTDASS